MAIPSKKSGNFKQISKREVEWTFKKNKTISSEFSKISDRKVEWKFDNTYKNFIRFLEKVKNSKQPMTYIYRFSKYKFFKELNKDFPKSTVFLSKILEKYPHNIKLMYAPGTMYLAPFLIANKFKVTEKILLELSKRNISLSKILENEKVSMSILSKNFLFTDNFEKSKSFNRYLDVVEKRIKGNK